MFLDLFYGLREEGVPVAIQEWQGFLRALEEGLPRVLALDRQGVRTAAAHRHSADRMVDEYVAAYETVIRGDFR